MNIKLSVVIPAYNEAKNLQNGVLDEVENYLKNVNYNYEVLIIDDGSTDNTVEIVKNQIKNKKGFKLVACQHGGKAVTVMTGMLAAEGEIALFADLDQATPLNQVEKLLPKFEEGFDIVVGARSGRKGAPLIRKLMAFGWATIRTITLGLPFDTQCGFKAFNKSSRVSVFTELLKDWQHMSVKGAAVNAGFDVETLFLAKKKGFKIAEVEVSWHHVGTERVQLIRDSIDGIKDIIRIRQNDLMGKYG